MKKIISYVLWGMEGRYWGNTAYVLAANSAIYSDFCTRFYIHQESIQSPHFELLQKAQKEFPSLVEIEIIDEPIIETKLTIWRLKPIWEDDVDILLCRDLDHITSETERRAVEFFLRDTTNYIHGIRSYNLHSVPLLAGLCGFKGNLLRKVIRKTAPTFEDFIKWAERNVDYCKKGWYWGCDQALLRDFFGKLKLYPKVLDCPVQTAPLHIHGFNCNKADLKQYENIGIENCHMGALTYSDSIAPGSIRKQYSFIGAPCDATTDQVYALLDIINNDMTKMISDYYDRK